MKLPQWIARAFAPRDRKIQHAKLLLGMVVGALAVQAQPVVAPPPAVTYAPPALPQKAATSSPTDAPPAAPESSPFQWGSFVVRPHFVYRLLYGDGIQAQPGRPSTTAINSLSPGILMNLGTHWVLDYTPTQTYYSNHDFRDTLDHSASLVGGTAFEDWILQLSEIYDKSSPPLVETGGQTKQENYSTAFIGTYRVNSELRLDTTLKLATRLTDVFSDSRERSAGERLHYRFLPGLDTTVSMDFGSVDMSHGTDMSYTRPQVGISWRATDKIVLDILGGTEHRKFRTGGSPNLNNPIMSASLNFQPVETTKLTLSTDRDVTASYFQDEVTKNTRWNANLDQRLFRHFHLTAGYSWQKTDYLATNALVVAGREDRNYAFTARLSTTFFQRGTIAVMYQNGHNSSSDRLFAYTSSQVGFEIGYRY